MFYSMNGGFKGVGHYHVGRFLAPFTPGDHSYTFDQSLNHLPAGIPIQLSLYLVFQFRQQMFSAGHLPHR